jgi:hypothetical protein
MSGARPGANAERHEFPATMAAGIAIVRCVSTTHAATPVRQIRALHDAETVTVYQAYSSEIAAPAARDGRFSTGFSRSRMTWIKPSFCWMMYRSGWAMKPGQEHVLAIRIRRAGFDWAVANAALSSYEPGVHADRQAWKASLRSPARVQWDPERDVRLQPLAYRAVQIGLSGTAVTGYADDWIVGIDDITERCHRIHTLVTAHDLDAAAALLPSETVYAPAEASPDD